MQLLTKMIMRENQTLTFDQVYSLFQREFPHVRYADVEHNLMYPLRFLRVKDDFYFDLELSNGDVITALNGNSKWCLVDDNIILDNSHVFKVYNKPASNDELLRLIYGEAF